MNIDDPAWVRISLLQHYAYCPHQARLLDEGVWADNRQTVQGNEGHAHVDMPGRDHRRGVKVHHRVQIASQDLHLFGVADAVEENADGALAPVEHKRGRGTGNLFPSCVQVSAQALCVQEMTGQEVPIAWLYITGERRREQVVVADFRSAVLRIADHIRLMRQRVESSVPVYVRQLCRSCSVQNACQPQGGQWV